jgi:hypothetical protein
MKDFKWVIRSNQIKDCPVIFQDINDALKIWGKNIAALKGKTTQRKMNPVAREYVKVPKELLKIHKEVLMTTTIFFVNNIPYPMARDYVKVPKELLKIHKEVL